VTFADGAVINLGVSYALPEKYPALGHAARVEVLGTEGVMILDDDHTDQLMYTEKGIPHVYLPNHSVNMVFLQSGTPGDWALGEFWGPIANETRAWLDYLSMGRACVLATPQEARANLEATLAIEHSPHDHRTASDEPQPECVLCSVTNRAGAQTASRNAHSAVDSRTIPRHLGGPRSGDVDDTAFREAPGDS